MLYLFLVLLCGLSIFYFPRIKKIYATTTILEFTMEMIMLGICIVLLTFYIYSIDKSMKMLAKAQMTVNVAHTEYVRQMAQVVVELDQRIKKIESQPGEKNA